MAYYSVDEMLTLPIASTFFLIPLTADSGKFKCEEILLVAQVASYHGTTLEFPLWKSDPFFVC